MNTPKPAFGIVDVLDESCAIGARYAISAICEVLDCACLVKKEKLEFTDNTGGMFILPLNN